MEKQRFKSVTKSCRRLLILAFCLCCSSRLFSQTTSPQGPVLIRPSEDQNLFAKQDIKFEVILQNVKSNQVQINAPLPQQNINFKTFRKYDDYETNGTKLELWFSFDKKGTYQIQPLSVFVKGRRQNIRFEKIKIKENPANLAPRVVVTFDNGFEVYSDEPLSEQKTFSYPAGQKLYFTVNLQYAVQLVQYNWDLPTESILHQTETYDITEVKYREKTYSEDLIPVATFEWTVLRQGNRTIPKFRLTTTGYNGHKYDLFTPDYQINFDSSSVSQIDETGSIFDSAFEDAFTTTPAVESDSAAEITNEYCQMLVELRHDERHSIFNHSENVKNRKDFEAFIGLPEGNKEFTVIKFYISLILVIISIVVLIIMIIKKQILGIAVLIIITVSSIVFNISTIVQMNSQYAISTGSIVKSIPDEKASSSQIVSAGTRVLITETADIWSYIEVGTVGGWCKTESLLLIK